MLYTNNIGAPPVVGTLFKLQNPYKMDFKWSHTH